MSQLRLSASSYSNTAPLVWSFLYGKNHGRVELILDNAPARSAELLAQNRVDAALVPVIAFQMIDGLMLIPDVCVGTKKRVRSVCIVTDGRDLSDVKSVSLDISSQTSVVLTKIIFREFLGFEPVWRDAKPDVDAMLAESDAALIIGDPALVMSEPRMVATGFRADLDTPDATNRKSVDTAKVSDLRSFDLAELWNEHTGLGFVFAMWMTRRESVSIDFAAARDEGLAHLDEIVANYETDIQLGPNEMRTYLSENVSYSVNDSMLRGMELYFDLASKNKLIADRRPLTFI